MIAPPNTRPRLSANTFPIGIIGTGAIVKDAHLPAYRLAGFPVWGVMNRTVSRAEELAEAYGIPLAMTYGYERLRFPKPVFIGDTITTRITVVEKRDHKRPTDGIVSERLEVTNQRGETVLACDHLLLVKRRETRA